ASCYSGPETLGKALQPLLARQDADFRYADQALSAPESLTALLEQGGDWYRQLDQLDAQARAAWRAARGASSASTSACSGRTRRPPQSLAGSAG
ncbi:hypothetical protein, partial [Vibrio vulnificus]|uniref:hypothetical protein n=1 Tax=Vibrio vulnificus TaxID=672 RepID=UPI0019D4A1C0